MENKNDTFLPKVYGLNEVKEELRLIHGWYKDPDTMGKRKSMLPKGLLFYGRPGSGKTMLMREFSRRFDCPVYEIEGNSKSVENELLEVYEKASKEAMAIVVIDEMDKLVRKDDKLSRILQAQLDGFREKPCVLTLATANERRDIPEALLREGRFDRQFRIALNGPKETEEAVRGFLLAAGLSIKEEDIPELIDEFDGETPIHIASSINGAALRKGDECDIDDIIDSSYFLHRGIMPKREDLEVERRTAVHEAGHAAYLHFFARRITYGRIYFVGEGGGFTSVRQKEKVPSVESINERIQTDLAGLIAEELVFGSHDVGSGSDLDDAHTWAFKLVNMTGINGVDEHCQKPQWCEPSEQLSQVKVHSFETASEKYVLRQYKKAKRRMKKVKEDVIRLSDFLLENKKASKQDIARILGPVD